MAYMPSEVSPHVSWFDRFATGSSAFVSKAWFFSACVVLIVVWLPTLFLMNFDTSQLLINTATTIVTFLLVALLQNTQERNDKASQHKLNAMCLALYAMTSSDEDRYERAEMELEAAMGLEDRESS